VEARLAGTDPLPCDNQRFVTFTVREPRKVLIVADVPAKAERWVEAIESRRDARFRCKVVAAASAAKLAPGELAEYHAIYLFCLSEPPASLWQALHDYVERGGGVGVIPGGEEMKLAAYNAEPAAQALLPGTIKEPVSHKDPGAAWTWDDDRIYQHPMLRPVREWRDSGWDKFIKVPRTATRYWLVQPRDKDVTVLVRYADDLKRPALLERRFGKGQERGGRVLLFTTRLDMGQEPRWNNYMETSTDFCVVLPGLATDYLAGDAEAAPVTFVSGQGVPEVLLPLTGRSTGYTIRGPGAPRAVSVEPKQNVLLLRQATAPGNYAVEDQDHNLVAAFSVNLPAEECDLTRVPAAQIEALFGRGAVVPAQEGGLLGESLHGHLEQPFELLPLVLLLLLMLLAAENLLANLFYKRD
jgi:hypothetical protein